MHFGKEREKAEGKANFSLKNTGKKEGMQVKWTEFGKFFPHPLLYLIQKKVFKYPLKCVPVELPSGVGYCELTCCIVLVGSILTGGLGFSLVKLQNFLLYLHISEAES